MLDKVRRAMSLGPMVALNWIIKQAQLEQMSKKARRRLMQGDKGIRAQANEDRNVAMHRKRLKLRNRKRNKLTRALHKTQRRAA